ncbi:MAG TPA: LCP family protein [Candidatus Limnocylindria bacterium]|nr:LCP family protein [Candidatus Limnocylindria bacterium]
MSQRPAPARRASLLPAILGVLAVLAIVAAVLFFLLGQQRGQVGASPSPVRSPSPFATQRLNAELLNRRWTVLVVGLDVNQTRAERGEPVNTDALQLVSLSEDQSELAIIGVPRDLTDIPLPDGSTWDGKVNAIYRERDLETLRDAMAALFEVEIDAHVVLDMDDFRTVVEGVGGIDVEPDEPLADPRVDLSLEPGPQELDGTTALAYVRTRVDQDYGRVRRQGEVILAVIERLADPTREVDVDALVDDLDSLQTDLPLDELPTLVELARRAADAGVEHLVLEPPDYIGFEGDRGDGSGYILEPNIDAIREAATRLIDE